MAFIRTQIIGGRGVIERLRAVRARALDLRPFWNEVFAPKYFATVQDLFALEGQRRRDSGRFGGGSWAPLSPSYAAWKARHYPGERILSRTGALRDSLAWTGSGLGPGGVWLATKQGVEFGTAIPYAQYHAKGTGTMPARPFMDPPNKTVFVQQLRAWLTA